MFLKFLFIMLCIVLIGPVAAAVIVNNSTSSPTGEDSLSFVFYSLDSLGNPTTADSLYIMISGPNGTIVYKDSTVISDNRVTSTTIRTRQFYSFTDQVSNLDGSGEEGVYSISLMAFKSTENLLTPNIFSFQIISDEFSDQIGLIDDSGFVARSVWNSPQDNHTGFGTFGKYLDTEVSGIATGSGNYPFTIITYDSTTDQVIPGADVVVRNIDQSALVALGATGSLGTVTFNLDSDSFTVVVTDPGWLFDPGDTIVVSGVGTDTVYGDQFDPGNPTSPMLCRVYGYILQLNGNPETGATATARLPHGVVRAGSVILSPFELTTSTDTSGYFYFDLVPSDSLIPDGSVYEISVSRSDGSILRKRVQVPAQSNWQLTW